VKAGILGLSLSIPVLLIVIMLSAIVSAVWFKYNRDISILGLEGATIDRFQFVLDSHGYVDTCSGNLYPVVSLTSMTRSSLTLKTNSRDGNEYTSLHLFPILLFSDGVFELAWLEIQEEDASLLIYY